jgi:hypothetical protein
MIGLIVIFVFLVIALIEPDEFVKVHGPRKRYRK